MFSQSSTFAITSDVEEEIYRFPTIIESDLDYELYVEHPEDLSYIIYDPRTNTRVPLLTDHNRFLDVYKYCIGEPGWEPNTFYKKGHFVGYYHAWCKKSRAKLRKNLQDEQKNMAQGYSDGYTSGKIRRALH